MVIIHYKIKDIPIGERPRERVKQNGISNITNKELIAIILKTGTRNLNATDLALNILVEYPIEEFKNLTLAQLTKIKGIGEVKALELLAAIELGKRINYTTAVKQRKKLNNPEAIWQETRYLFVGKKQELIERKLLFMGTVNKSITHPREIFKEAYKNSASSIVCLHNHPSNDLCPSTADINFTKSLMEIGRIQGIPLIDHIIVGDDSFYSFYEHGNILNQ